MLLFRTRGLAAKMTRKFTHSKFDHVAIILRFDCDTKDLFFLDATGAGVTVTKWSKFRLVYDKAYYHLFYR